MIDFALGVALGWVGCLVANAVRELISDLSRLGKNTSPCAGPRDPEDDTCSCYTVQDKQQMDGSVLTAEEYDEINRPWINRAIRNAFAAVDGDSGAPSD